MAERSSWAAEKAGRAELRDARRNKRWRLMFERAAKRPSGRVSDVFTSARELQGAYDFLESKHADAGALIDGVCVASVVALRAEPCVVIAVDGTSLQLTDRTGRKGLGKLGSYATGSTGVKLINALAVRRDGKTADLVDQQYWCRKIDRTRSVRAGAVKKKRNQSAPTSAKETQRWIDSIDASEKRFRTHAPETRRVYVVDREGDNRDLLRALAQTEQAFVVRSSSNRRIEIESDGGPRHLRPLVDSWDVVADRDVAVRATSKRAARVAKMQVRFGKVTLHMRAQHGRGELFCLTVNVVEAREVGTNPRHEKPLVWTLLTNVAVGSAEASANILDVYAMRWRIEDFHRTLKTSCGAESMQLRSEQAIVKWATVLSAVAARIERLKHLARESPEAEATVELTAFEIRALILLKRREKKRTETVPNTTPTIATALRWIADLGGYTGKSSGGPPGSVTIARGLERVRVGAEILEEMAGSDQ